MRRLPQMRDRSARQDRGAVIPMVALALTMLMTMTAFAVDLGRMRTERRDLQADADAMAMDAVQAIQGLSGGAAQTAAELAAQESAARNGVPLPETTVAVQVGRWDIASQQLDTAATFPNAVQVDLHSVVDMFFDFSTDTRAVSRRAVAVASGQVMGELGSVVAGIQPDVPDPTEGCAVGAAASIQMTVMNHIYTALFGFEAGVDIGGTIDYEVDRNINCQVTQPDDGLKLDAVSYNGLAAARLDLRDYATVLNAGSPEQLADVDISRGTLLQLTADALQRGEDPTTLRYQAGSQLRLVGDALVAQDVGSETVVDFGDVFQSSTGGEDAVFDTSVSALDVLFMAATMIDGNNFVGADGGLEIPLPLGPEGASVQVPAKVHVIELPQRDTEWKSAGDPGPRTSQVSIALDVPLNVSNLPVDLSLLGISLIEGTATVNGTGSLPLVIEVGHATSSYSNVACPSDGSSTSSVDMGVTSGAARIRLGAVAGGDTDFSDGISVTTPSSLFGGASAGTGAKLSLLGIPIGTYTIDLSASSVPSPVGPVGQNLSGTLDTTLDTNVGLNAGGGSGANTFSFTPPHPTAWWRYRGGFGDFTVEDAVLASVNLDTVSGGLLSGLTESDLRAIRDSMIDSVIGPVVDQLDAEVLQPVFNALGATLGGADARILKVRCSVPALANRDSGTS